MKKRILLILFIGVFSLIVCGCDFFKKDDLDNATIYTTVYPIEYLIDRLYGYNSKLYSIYPNGIDVNDYELSDKQIKDYSNSSIFIYNGESDEKEIAKEFINKNNDLKIIDASYGIRYTYGVEELWLSPNNYLMLASNIKSGLDEMITSKYVKTEIKKNFDVLEEEISLIDAELRSIGASSKSDDKNNILIASNVLQFLNNYDFNTILLRDESDMTTSLRNQLKSNKFKYILICDNDSQSDYLKEIIENNKLEVIEVKTMTVLTDEDRKSNENYLSITKNFLEQMRKVGLEKE